MEEISKKIYYHDTDCGGVVYYANYLKYFEEARTEYMQSKGVSIKDLSRKNILFVVRKVEVDYKSPAFYGDTVKILSGINKMKNVSMDFFQEIRRDNVVLVYAVTKMVCVNSAFTPVIIPEDVAECLRK